MCSPFFWRNIFWVWVPRGMVVRNLLSHSVAKDGAEFRSAIDTGRVWRKRPSTIPETLFKNSSSWNGRRHEQGLLVLPSVSCTIYTLSLWGWTPLTILEWILFPGFTFLALLITMIWTKFLQLPDEKPLCWRHLLFLYSHPSSLFLSHTPSFCCVSVRQV